ncbi:MAG: hypothetical protein V1899_10610 [Planctomycetota bacterium]
MAAKFHLTAKNVIISLFALLLIGAGAGGTYLADRLYYKPMREQKQLIENLESIIGRLSKEIRLAEVSVLEQTENPLKTKFRFDEVDERGDRISRREFTVDGDIVYFDALVIKFDDHLQQLRDLPLKEKGFADQFGKKSLILFRRVFGQKQKPEDGFPLDTPDEAPTPYKMKATPPTAFEQKLWKDFWKIANDPKLAKQYDIRAAHGEAPFMKLQKNMVYVLQQRLTGGLEIKAEPVRSVLQP